MADELREISPLKALLDSAFMRLRTSQPAEALFGQVGDPLSGSMMKGYDPVAEAAAQDASERGVVESGLPGDLGTAIDFTPVLGDAKFIVEAALRAIEKGDYSLFKWLPVALATVGPVGKKGSDIAQAVKAAENKKVIEEAVKRVVGPAEKQRYGRFLGFSKDPTYAKEFAEQAYPFTLNVKVTDPLTGETFIDAIKGLNKGHALARAKYNWEVMNVEPLDAIDDAVTISIGPEARALINQKKNYGL